MNVPILKRIVWLVATSQPFKPNFEKISKNLGISKPSLYIYLDYLEKSGLLSGVMAQGAGSKLARKPAKIYLGNTNLLRAVSGELSREDPIGTIRETFVQHQLDSAGLLPDASSNCQYKKPISHIGITLPNPISISSFRM